MSIALDEEFMNMSKEDMFSDFLDKAINAIKFDESGGLNTTEAINAIKRIQKVHKGNINELMAYRENFPIIVKYIADLFECYTAYKFVADMHSMPEVNSNKKWSKDSDSALIEALCNDTSISTLATAFHRSPSAIATRVSKLVGVTQKEKKVNGKFVGDIDGEHKEAILDGKVFKG